MIIRGSHFTHYRFDEPVILNCHTVRLRPRSGGGQQLRSFNINVDPIPAAATEAIDTEGNGLHSFWFFGHTDHLDITTSFEVETNRLNPFDFVPAPETALPPRLSPEEKDLLRSSLTVSDSSSPTLSALVRELSAACDGTALDYTIKATLWINRNIDSIHRGEGAPLPSEETLWRKSGACRDLAALLIDLCRRVGIPARFVSGYQETFPAEGWHDLHAWAEVWLPGGGWRGFDPTQGLAVAAHHIALVASALQSLAAPVSGSFGGEAAPPVPTHEIKLSTV